jgi:hypothetical protein|tara:strand:- start:16998 stop:17165 length:168 start_codon:yes stop_codon:yes gene_type:complete
MYTREMIVGLKNEISNSHNKRMNLVLASAENVRKQLENVPDIHLDKIIIQNNIII